ncbi:hypothetical protein [Saccharibacillus sacchari]|uniref:Uncharacterized protein n=1 Tax=Saccharibacillus sacchari TaxID=456493 RepID=A0ACC6P6U7_9BACL
MLIENKNDLPAQLEHVRQHSSDIEEYAKRLAGTKNKEEIIRMLT